MNVIRDFITGGFSVMKIIGAPMLYRYPYRTSAEALRSDWLKIGNDVENVIGRLQSAAAYEREQE